MFQNGSFVFLPPYLLLLTENYQKCQPVYRRDEAKLNTSKSKRLRGSSSPHQPRLPPKEPMGDIRIHQ